MPWRPLPRIAFAICIYPYVPSAPTDLPLQIGDELYIIEQGGKDGTWYRGYLVAPPSLLAGLTSGRGQALEARVFSGIFPRECVEVRELLGDATAFTEATNGDVQAHEPAKIARGAKMDTSVTKQKYGAAAGTHVGDFAALQFPVSVGADNANVGERPPAPVPMLKIGDESVLAKGEPLVDEIASCLREWHSTYLHELLLNRQYQIIDKISDLVEKLDVARRQLLHKLLTQQELSKLRESAVWDLVRGNKLLSGDIIVRSPAKKGKILTAEDSAIELSQLQTSMSLLNEEPSVPVSESRQTFHVLVQLSKVSVGVTKPTTYILSLYSKAPGQKAKLLSESFAVDAYDKYKDGSAFFDARARCLFTDLTQLDIGEATSASATIFLAIKTMSTESPASSTPSVRLQAPSSPASDGVGSIPNLNGTWRAAAFRNPRMSVLFNPKGRGDGFPSEQSSDNTLSVSNGSETSGNETASVKTSDTASQRPVRRITSIGVIDIGPCIRSLTESDQICHFRAPSLISSQASDQEALYDDTIAEIFQDMRGLSYKYTSVNKMHVNVHPFSHPDSRALINETPTLLQSINYAERIGFSGAPTRPRSDIFLTLNKPYLPKGALLVHPKTGTAPIMAEIGMANLMLTMEVRSASGDRIENCIYPSANSTGHTAWRTPAVGRGESWNQTIRLAIGPEQVPGSHVVMSLADTYEFPFALCWIPLWDEDAFVSDGAHSLALYKYDEFTSSLMSGQGAYLQLPWSSKTKDETVTGPLAALHIDTTLCSTKYSSNPSLLGLLKWREQRSSDVQAVLKNFPFVPEIEVVKLLDETLNSLFEILVENAGNDEVEDLVFYNLVVVLEIVNDRRFNLQPLVDQYISTAFYHPFAFGCLVQSFARLLQDPQNHENARRLREAAKVGGYLFKFMVASRQQQITKEIGIGITGQGPTIAKDLMPIFRALEKLMRDSTPVLIGTKTVIVQNYHTWLPALSTALSAEETLALANNFMESCADVTGRLLLYRLVSLNSMSALNLWEKETTRTTWYSKVQQWLAPHWGRTSSPSSQWRDQVRLCCTVVATLITTNGAPPSPWLPKLLESYNSVRASPEQNVGRYSALFPPAYPIASKPSNSKDKHDEALIEIAALIAMCSNSARSMFVDIHSKHLSTTIQDCLHAYTSILNCDAYPAHWLSVHVFHHRTALQALEQTFAVLETRFLPPPEDVEHFDPELWRLYLTTLFSVIGSEAIALEGFSEQKRRAVWKVGGDIRESGAELLQITWETLGWDASPSHKKRFGLAKMGGYQVSYVPSLVGPILQLCLSVHDNLRNAATAILHSMIIGEGTLNEDLTVIKAEMIDSLEKYFKSRPLNDGMVQKLFVDELADRMKACGLQRDDPLYPHVKNLLQALDQLLDLLIAVHSSDANNEASHIIDTLRLLEFFKDMQKEQMYVSYLHKLADLQSQSQNSTEAALALKLHADMYDWNTSRVVSAVHDPVFPKQTAAERKEQIYFLMIGHLEEGAAWHEALAAYEELADHYRNRTFDFSKLARTQRAMAAIHERISRAEVQSPRYFKVSFEGLGFSPNLRDRQFIYETAASDRLASFTDRILAQYPSAQIVTAGNVGDLEGQFISISPVSPQKNLLHPIARRTRISQSVKNHYLLAKPAQFTTTSRRQATKGGIYEQIMEKIVYTTSEAFPTILRRSEIISQEKVRVPPIQIGIERAMRKTQDLVSLEEEARKAGDASLGKVTEALGLLVGSDSSGNVVGYWELLPASMKSRNADEDQTKAGRQEDRDELDDVMYDVLKATLIDHAAAIRSCLHLYMRPTRQAVGADLKAKFERSFAPVLAVMDILPVPDPPLLQHEEMPASPLGANPTPSQSEEHTLREDSTTTPQNGEAASPIIGSDSQFTAKHQKETLQAPSNEDRLFSKLSAFSRDFFDDSADATPPPIGGSRGTPKPPTGQGLQGRIGSMTKRLSSLNVSRRGFKAPFKGPTVGSVAERG